MSEEKKEKEKSAEPTEELKETGSANLENSRDSHRIKLLTIVGEIEGHEAVSGNTKATKYEHLLPLLAEVEDSNEIDGLLILLNTLGGDVEAGLSIAEMIASLSKPSVSLVLGEVTPSEVRLPYLRTIPLLCQAGQWSFIRCARTGCLSVCSKAWIIC